MIDHIDKYFNPSGTVYSLSHIFDLIDIKQAAEESVITLKAHFSRLFASLKMGGVAIDSALQVGFMLRALKSTYQGVVQDFRLGRHPLICHPPIGSRPVLGLRQGPLEGTRREGR
jgi:hypothetical protein